MTETTRIEVTVRDRRTDRVVFQTQREFAVHTSFTDAMDFAHAQADADQMVERKHRQVSANRVMA